MFGYTIVKKIYINRLIEECDLLYTLNENLLKTNQEVADANHKFVSKIEEVTAERDSIITSVAPEWDLDLNQPMAKTLREWLEIKEKHIEKLDKENGDLRLRARMAEQAVDMQLGKIVHLEGLNRELTETSRTPLPASESDHGVDWDVERSQPMWITMGDQSRS